MTNKPNRFSKISRLALAGTAAFALAACGSSGGDKTATVKPSSTVDARLAAQVPADIKSSGKITIGTDASYAPNEFFDTDGKTIIGMDVDLGQAIGAKLGLTVTFENADFSGIIPAVQSNKYQLAMSSFTDNTDREKVVDMVTYFTAGTSMAVKKGTTLSVDDLCGHKMAVQKGTVQLDDLKARSKKCTDAGKKAISLTSLPLQSDVSLAVVNGRAEGFLADSPVTAYAVKQSNGALEITGDAYDDAPYGIVVPKAKGEFAQAVLGALQALNADGTYLAILKKWGVEAGAITDFKVNGANG
ncbi:MAG: polar amino acid transport system substrate-binding protein [Frankiales bacterium]|jgi:polar amino acid transport system substrate-binding protein|nr:polar amino acid transport system substrate-binding protein [Frankiales bacterium]